MALSTVLLFIAVSAVSAAPSLDGRIVGGDLAKIGEFPYVVSLQVFGSHNCGGSIISEKYILTAAHCIEGFEDNPKWITIQYGVTNINSNENEIAVKRVIKKSDYKPGSGYFNDIALLELSESIKFSSNAQPIKLPNNSEGPGNNASAILVGWGKLGSNKPLPYDLYKVKLVLFTHEYCESKEDNYSPDHHVCAGMPQGGFGQCNGDSGGPLAVNGIQYGVVSWSVKPCASLGHPGVFANVLSYRDWIREQCGV